MSLQHLTPSDNKPNQHLVLPEALDTLREEIENRPRRRRKWLRATPLIAVGLAGTAAAATTSQWANLFGAADHVPISTEVLVGEHAEVLAVLRRPQTADDRSQAVQDIVRRRFAGGAPERALDLDGIRLLRSSPDRTIILVPARSAARSGSEASLGEQNRLCLIARSNAPSVASADSVEGRAVAASSIFSSCGTTEAIEHGRVRWENAAGTRYVGLVTDDVARITATSEGTTVAEASPVDNVYELELQPSRPGSETDYTVQAFRRDGSKAW